MKREIEINTDITVKEKESGMKTIVKSTIWMLSLLSVAYSGGSSERRIANMFMLGFSGTAVNKDSPVMKDICHRGLGGVILFDRLPGDRKRAKNISSPIQLKKLTDTLSGCRHKPLIAVDEEGGLVQRLKRKDGFYGRYPKASDVAEKGEKYARQIYADMAKELKKYGINMNLAPVADLSLNPFNKVIVKNGRSYGSDPAKTARYDRIFIDAMRRYGILSAVKHFPGHGSSSGDTHKGFVEVTKQWKKQELKPYELLIGSGQLDAIMVAHIFNREIDDRYPLSLSKKAIKGLLRKKMGFRGVVISDDLQMYAISKHYSLRDTIKLAINAGNDILLFGNQIDRTHRVTLKKLIDTTKDLLRHKEISMDDIDAANRRIKKMKKSLGI